MHKLLIFSFLFIVVSINAATFSEDEYLQIVAKELNTKENIVTAKGKVIVYSPTFYMTAEKLIYDRNNSRLELFEDVNIIKNNETVSFSQYAYIDLKKDTKDIKPMLLLDNNIKLWFNAKNATGINNSFKLDTATMSSCDCKDPSWSISFSSGDYNTTKQWINTYNTTLYIKNFPVFYTPYFGFPTDKTRRTGLLKPTIGFSNIEGFLYAQPIYFAPKLNYDFEYIPQNRVKRGYGHALKYRYKDSLYSNLLIETAMFKEKEEYKEKMNLVNQKHYGWNFEYQRTKLISNSNSTDGLIVKSLDMNDVDYINTKYDNDTNNYTNKFLESKVKYFYNTNNYYGDIDIRLYNDISKDNNDDVMQNIPTVSLHKYSNELFLNKLSSSVDISSTRKIRDVGLGANQTDIYIPINYHQYFFNQYLNITLSEQINYTNIKYLNNTNNYEDVNYGTNNHIIALHTDLIKPYENYLHNIQFNTTYTKPENFKKDGDIYKLTNNDSNLSIFPITQTNQSISLGLNQSLYNKRSLKEIVNHKINQLYVYNNEMNKYEKNDLQNDITYFYDFGSLSNRLIYNHNVKIITSSSTTFKYLQDNSFINIYYNYLKNKDTLFVQKNITYDIGTKFYKYYTVSYKDEYDLTQRLSKKKEYIFNIDKKCWAIDFKLIDSLVATNTTNNSVLRQNILYMELNLKQLFTLAQNYKFKQRSE